MTKSGYLKHKEIIDKWANGEEIQQRAELWVGREQWVDCGHDPHFFDWQEFRVKPKEKENQNQ